MGVSEIRLNSTRQAARDAKEKYADAVIKRASSQREVNDLLQRKSTWTDEDVSRFTTLVRLDHSLEQEEARAKVAMDNSEDAAEKEFNELMRAILTRYHEEQVWSDKIRGASTYGSLAALGLNLFVFVVAIVVVEPWKRKKMAMTFEAKIEAMNAEHKAAMEEAMKAVERKLGEQILILGKGLEGAVAEPMRKREDAGSDGDAATSSSRARSAWDGELGAVVVTSAALAGAIGWLAGTWKTS
jgi:sensitive to high expression protein 9